MHNRQAITPRRLWSALKDYDLWPVRVLFSRIYMTNNLKIYALGLICFIPQSPPGVYTTQILRSLGFSTVSRFSLHHVF
jgi:hypothetical protein